jgi:cytidine deaminase
MKESYMEQIWRELYQAAKAVQHPREISERVSAGGVAAAIESASGRMYTGVCIDTSSSLGICAEQNAMFNMITNGEDEIRRVLAIMPDGKTEAPCGACREFMTQLMLGKDNDVEIMLDLSMKE